MYNGQHSLVPIAGLLVVVAFRFIASQRRRNGRRPGSSTTARGLTSSVSRPDPMRSQEQELAEAPEPRAGAAFTGTASGWFTDPFVRHEQRYWSGTAWTEHVQDKGAPGIDPPPQPRSPGA